MCFKVKLDGVHRSLECSTCPAPPSSPQHPEILQHQVTLKVRAGTHQQKGGLAWGSLFPPISAHCPVIPPNDLSLQGLCMQEVPPSVNYDWFAMLLDDCLYHPLPSMTFLRPLNRALQSIHLERRWKILMIVAKLATFDVISWKKIPALVDCIWIK